ncbi:NTP transferase domain-containing protein [Haloferula sp.]|uniref:NTP transferase domain-containing protein n=1 Tax=Haloferula sp. TaxID=2497595 RepID=UPI003C76D815
MIFLILAGGKSRRMGRDKALIERPDGTRQLDHVIALAQSISPDLLISTNSPDIVPAGIPILPDLNPGDGPLGALASFHQAHPDEAVLLIGCDLFLLDKATVTQLVDAHTADESVTCFKSRIDARPEPLCAIYESTALAMASTALANNEFCARHFVESLQPKLLDLPNPVALDNANTPADLEEAFAKINHGVSNKSVKVLYFAKLREERGLDEEEVETLACTPAGLYDEIAFRHRLSLKPDALRCARNGDFCDWNTRIEANDEIVFIPPVAGG